MAKTTETSYKRMDPTPETSIAPTKWLLLSVVVAIVGGACAGDPPLDAVPPPGPKAWLEASAGWVDRSEFGNDAFEVGSQSGLLGLADADDLNMGGPWSERTIAVAFVTSGDVDARQMVFEMGGDLRGLNVYLDEGQLYMSAYNLWNDDGGRTTPFGPLVVNAPVTEGTAYAVILELDQGSGTVRGWVNGGAIGVRQGAGRLFQHHEDTGIGAINEDTYYHDGVRQGVAAADFFAGEITHVLVYNRVLRTNERSALSTYLETE